MTHINFIRKASTLVAMLSPRKTNENYHKKLKPITYRVMLSGPFNGQYLTKREAECVYYAMENQTIKKTGAIMKLSPRTIEFYLKRIRKKLSCPRKKDLVFAMRKTSFLREFSPLKGYKPKNIQ
jgi:DNA-binding CsgD family transcriptional regulator